MIFQIMTILIISNNSKIMEIIKFKKNNKLRHRKKNNNKK